MKQITNIPGSRPCPTCGAYNYDDESECQQCGASMRTPDQIPVQRRVQSPQR